MHNPLASAARALATCVLRVACRAARLLFTFPSDCFNNKAWGPQATGRPSLSRSAKRLNTVRRCLRGLNHILVATLVVCLQPTVIASRAPHLLLEQSVMTIQRMKIQRIVDVHRPSTTLDKVATLSTMTKLSKINIGDQFSSKTKH